MAVYKVRLDIVSNGNNTTEYILKLDVAKELSMLSRSEKGKQVRRYFIEVEKKYKALKVPQSYAQALLEAGRLALELEKVELENKVQKQYKSKK